MKFYWVKTTLIIKKIFSDYVWEIPNNEKKIYLTFDDGPTPEITEWVLEQLKEYNAKATFFCIGNNIKNNPTLFNSIIEEEHSIGNHTFNHLNGWKTRKKPYLENSDLCTSTITEHHKLKTLNRKLFRPPYGKIKTSQARELNKSGYKIIMWDVLSADFDQKITPEQCLKNVLQNTTSGSIIVFHDSIKAYPNLKYVLPKALAFFKENGFICDAIN
ncbi:MAG: polysaccharide deacetylase family protein [Bacteroidota bacterium]